FLGATEKVNCFLPRRRCCRDVAFGGPARWHRVGAMRAVTGSSGGPPGPAKLVRTRARLLAIALTLGACSAGVAGACGGTTGRDGLPMPGEVPLDATIDGTALDAAPGYDSPIVYADRELPDISPPPSVDASGEAGNPWPDCPPFIITTPKGA